MAHFANFNDGSTREPRLRVGQALWGMIGLPMNGPTEWTLEEKFARCRDAGFQHVECWLADEASQTEVPPLLEKYGLKLALGHRPNSVADTLHWVDIAGKLGAEWLLCQPATAYHSQDEVVDIVRTGAKAADELGFRYFVETHRNNFTETIPQTLRLIDAVPEIKITADLSHFVVVGEFYGWDGEGALGRMQPILDKVGHVHGRISNGEQVQVDVGDGSTDPARFFVKLWTYIFRKWRETAQSGDIMPFSSELGPPRYAITTPDGKEISDRWEQGIVMKQLAEEAWANSK